MKESDKFSLMRDLIKEGMTWKEAAAKAWDLDPEIVEIKQRIAKANVMIDQKVVAGEPVPDTWHQARNELILKLSGNEKTNNVG